MPTEPIVYLNGNHVELSHAQVSVLDRGFIFGDGVYEVIPAYGGHPFRLQQHLERLNNSLNAIRIKNPLSVAQWQSAIDSIIKANHYDDQSIYLQVTRGVAAREHAFPRQDMPTVFIMTSPLESQSAHIGQEGIKAITLPDNRWLNCHIKSISLLPSVLLRQEALENNAQEAILIRDGLATEGAASNIFIVTGDCLITPPTGPHLLPGVTRNLIVELARKHSTCLKERDINEAELFTADEIWVSSSTKEILPVTTLNDKIVGSGKPGPYWQKMMTDYQALKQQLRSGQH
jgi:D-alanine transaminase